MRILPIIRDFNPFSLSTGVTASVWYFVGSLPIMIAVSGRLEVGATEASSWLFICYFTAGLAGLIFSLLYRQPIPVGWTIPGIIYLGTLAGQFSFDEIVGANLIAGFLIILIGVLKLGSRILIMLPLPIILGMFAGSILNYVTRMVTATVGDLPIGGLTIAGYLLGRAVASPKLPPLSVALLFGGVASAVWGQSSPSPIIWAPPIVVIPTMSFSLPAFITISIPMVILSAGLGTVQGLGYLISQKYSVRSDAITLVVGICSTINALFGGHPAIVARSGAAILAGPEGGPMEQRYTGNLIASFAIIIIALFATPLVSLIGILPKSYVVVLAGLAILSPIQDALEKCFNSNLRFGALIAFGIAATRFTLLGITSAVWAIVGGLIASLASERSEILSHWKS